MCRHRWVWAGFGIASAATSPGHGQDSVGNLDEPGWTWVTSRNAKTDLQKLQNVSEWKKLKEYWSNEQHQNLREMRLRFYTVQTEAISRMVGPDRPSFFFVQACEGLFRRISWKFRLNDWCDQSIPSETSWSTSGWIWYDIIDVVNETNPTQVRNDKSRNESHRSQSCAGLESVLRPAESLNFKCQQDL